MENNKQNKTRENILKRIKSGNIKMKPKAIFALKIMGLILLIVIFAIFVIFLISFILYALNFNNAWLLTSFGLKGVISFISAFPWILILLVFLFIIIIEIFINRFGFAYHRPILYSIILVLLISLLLGVFIYKTPLHKNLSCLCGQNLLPVMRPLYEKFERMNFPNFIRGKILQIEDEELTIQNPAGEILKAILTSESYPFKDKNLKMGDIIILTGNKQNEKINISEFEKEQHEELKENEINGCNNRW